jgi:hypothetical protein
VFSNFATGYDVEKDDFEMLLHIALISDVKNTLMSFVIYIMMIYDSLLQLLQLQYAAIHDHLQLQHYYTFMLSHAC